MRTTGTLDNNRILVAKDSEIKTPVFQEGVGLAVAIDEGALVALSYETLGQAVTDTSRPIYYENVACVR